MYAKLINVFKMYIYKTMMPLSELSQKDTQSDGLLKLATFLE